MIKLTNYIVAVLLCLIVTQANAQDSLEISGKQAELARFESYKKQVEQNEKDALKIEIEGINDKLDSGAITNEEADKLKQEAAEKRALNIKNKVAIIDNQMAIIERDDNWEENTISENRIAITIGGGEKELLGIKGKRTPPKYDIRTTNQLLVAAGFNNAIIEGQSFNSSPYENLGSGFIELGWNWQTRLAKNSNFARIKYGFSFQWNKLNLKEDQFFVQNGDVTSIEKSPVELKKSEFRTTNLVFPVYFEFGPSNKVEKKRTVRYQTWDKFKFGIGGFGGIRLQTQQKLKYKEDGDRVKQKTRRSYNTSPFVYGVGAYVGVGDFALYAKYDLNPLFKNQDVKQNNISLGIRMDFD
ncbi:hypothetical protein [Aurantibacter sp.]|uniref:hypothetical protein n=1 Tax=Aurantibacter sp. TaxID=2807103 RepID=UPI0035C85FCA